MDAPGNDASDAAPASRAALEQRAARLGIAYAGFMPTDALLAELHEREPDAAPAQDPRAAADRIEHEIDAMAALHGLPALDGDDDAAAANDPQ